jgi:hypothetical protein
LRESVQGRLGGGERSKPSNSAGLDRKATGLQKVGQGLAFSLNPPGAMFNCFIDS